MKLLSIRISLLVFFVTITEAAKWSSDKSGHAPESLAVSEPDGPAVEDTQLAQIFKMCFIMYSSIALVWVVTRVPSLRDDSRVQVVVLMVSWASTSIGMHILNKSLVVCLEAPALISAVQMVIAAVAFAPRCVPELWTAPLPQVLRWCIVPIFFAAMLTTSFYAYEYMSLTLLTIVRNLSPLVVLPLETLLMPPEKRPVISGQAILAICLMLVGALAFCGTSVETVSWVGIGFAVLNMVVAISDRLLQRRLLTSDCSDLSAGACTLINNTLGILPTLILAQASGQFSSAASPAHKASWTDGRVLLLLLASGLVGIGISWLGLECQRVISATSFIVMQNASKIFVVLAGVTFFGDEVRSAGAIGGLCLSLVGSWLYGAAQMQASKPNQKDPSPRSSLQSNASAKNV